MRGLRYILKIDHSYYSHITNEEVIERMNLALNNATDAGKTWTQFRIDKEFKNEDYKKTKLVGDLILERQMTLLGHVLRLDSNHLMRSVAFDDNLKRPQQIYKKTGHPRDSWVGDNLQRAHTIYGHGVGVFNDNNQEHVDKIKKSS